jgi:predicted ester cyclase
VVLQVSDARTTDRRVGIAREFVARVFNGHQPQLAREYVTPEVVWHGGSLGTVSGVDGLTGLLNAFLGALPDLRAEEQDVIASDDLVVMRLVVSATHEGDLLGIPATGRRVTWDAVDIYRVTDDGKISEEWASDDMAAFASQLGAFSLPWAS